MIGRSYNERVLIIDGSAGASLFSLNIPEIAEMKASGTHNGILVRIAAKQKTIAKVDPSKTISISILVKLFKWNLIELKRAVS